MNKRSLKKAGTDKPKACEKVILNISTTIIKVLKSRAEARNLLGIWSTFSRDQEIRHRLGGKDGSIGQLEATQKIRRRQHPPPRSLQFSNQDARLTGTEPKVELLVAENFTRKKSFVRFADEAFPKTDPLLVEKET